MVASRRTYPPGQLPSVVADLDLRTAEWVARLLDDWKLDPLLGLLPGGGDVLSSLLGLIIVGVAARRGTARPVLARMLLNLAVDSAVGAIPVVGDAFDLVHRANRKNLELLQARERTAGAARPGDWLVLGGAALAFAAAMALPLVLCGWLFTRMTG